MDAGRLGSGCTGLSSHGLNVSYKLILAPFKLLFAMGMGTGAVLYHLASARLAKRRAEDPREAVGQREVESLTRGNRWVHLPVRQCGRVVPMAFAAVGVLTWPVLAWRYGVLRSAVFCVPCGVLQMYAVWQSLGLDPEGLPFLWRLITPACLAAAALLLARVDTPWQRRRLLLQGWVSQGSIWVPRAMPTRGKLARHGS